LSDAGCTDIICKSNQCNPLSSETSVFGLFLDNSYLQKRLNFFSDKSDSYSLFYIPQDQKREAKRALNSIEKAYNKQLSAGIDVKESYPLYIPCIGLAFFIILFVLAINKTVFLSCSLVPLVYCFFYPQCEIVSSVCLVLLAVYYIQRLWGKRLRILPLFFNIYTLVLFLTFVIINFVVSIENGLFSVLIVSTIYAVMVYLQYVQHGLEKIRGFSYSFIISSKMYPIVTKKASLIFLLCLLPLSFTMVVCLSGEKAFVKANNQSIELPVPVNTGVNNEQLVKLDDCYQWAWNTLVFPYKNVNKSGDENIITVNHYVSTDTGIQVTESVLFEYNKEFKDSVVQKIQDLQSPAIENLLQCQSATSDFDYVRVSSNNEFMTQKTKKSVILLAVALIVPVMLFIYYYMFGRKNYESSK